MRSPAQMSAVLEVANTLTARARIVLRRDRQLTWYQLARKANAKLDSGIDEGVLRRFYIAIWNADDPVPELSTMPDLAVRFHVARALADPADAVQALTSAVEASGRLQAGRDPQAFDAAIRAIARQSLLLNEKALSAAGPVNRGVLAEHLLGASKQTSAEVLALTGMARTVLGFRAPAQISDPVKVPTMLARKTLANRLGPITSGLDRDTQQRIQLSSADNAAVSDSSREYYDASLLPVLNLLTADAPTWLPRTEPDRFNVGLVSATEPTVPCEARTVRPDATYLVWASVGPADPDALPDPLGGVDLSRMIAGDSLDVVLFGDTEHDGPQTGTFLLGSGRPLRVGRQASTADVPEELQETRLYFRFRTPSEPGRFHLRLCLYHHNALLRVHHLILDIHRRTARFEIRTPYTIAGSPTTSQVGRLAQRRMSLYTNSTGDGTHDFFFRAAAGARTTALSAVFDSAEVQTLLRTVRGGLRSAAWGSNAPVDSTKYKYGPTQDGMFGSTFHQLRGDLIDLARAGYDTWEQITSRFSARQQRADLQELMRLPGGVIDIAPRTNSTFVPPMAALYDIDLDTEIELAFCPEAAEALRSHASLGDTACFGTEGCAHADEGTVCPSGFWGLRHDIGVPQSGAGNDDSDPHLVVGAGGLRSALVGTMPEQVLAGVTSHADDVRQLLPGSVHVTDRDAWFTEAAKPAAYPILYFLCHGEERQRGGPVLVLDHLGRAGISKSNLKAKNVALEHRPLVVMNACDTAALEPEKAISLVQGFTYNGAGAVVGTEITIFPSLAYGFATSFLTAILRDSTTLGTALRTTRLELLRRGNPLGLAYILYGLPDARLS